MLQKQPPSLGVEVRALNEEELSSNKLTYGLRILRVTEGGAAFKSGIKANDILIEVNGKAVKDVAGLKAILSNESLEKFKVVRDGEILLLDVVATL